MHVTVGGGQSMRIDKYELSLECGKTGDAEQPFVQWGLEYSWECNEFCFVLCIAITRKTHASCAGRTFLEGPNFAGFLPIHKQTCLWKKSTG